MLQEGGKTGMFDGNPKTMFFLGLFVGVSTITTVCLALVLGIFLTGKAPGLIAAAAPTQQAAAAPTDTNPTAEDPTAAAPTQPVKAVDEKVDHIRGNKNAKVTLIEYADFECPYCSKHAATLDQILKDYPNDVRLVFRNFPLLSLHEEAEKAAEAAECAGVQGKYWEMHDEIFKANTAGTMSVDQWKKVAASLKLDTAKFNTCLDSGETAARVSQDETDGMAAGVQGTPATFVNGQLVEGAVPIASLKSLIDAELK